MNKHGQNQPPSFLKQPLRLSGLNVNSAHEGQTTLVVAATQMYEYARKLETENARLKALAADLGDALREMMIGAWRDGYAPVNQFTSKDLLARLDAWGQEC